MSKSILDDINIDYEQAEKMAKSVQNGDLQPIATFFARNVKDLYLLLSLPLIVWTIGNYKQAHLSYYTLALVRTGHAGKGPISDEAEATVNAGARRLMQSAKEDPSSGFKPVENARKELAHFLNEEERMEGATRVLLYMACTSAWTSFECLAKDAWIAALNNRPLQLAQPVLSRLPEDPQVDGLVGKQVSVGLLARHGFDLRNKLGSILSPKFDFSSVSGIRIAYEATFGKSIELSNLLSVPELSRLEAIRHVIVHRAGLVDDVYLRRTGDSASLGIQLPLTGAQVNELVNTAIKVGVRLLCIIDAWFMQNPPRDAATTTT